MSATSARFLIAALTITTAVAQETVTAEPDATTPVPVTPPPPSAADVTSRADNVAAALLDMDKKLQSEAAKIADIPEKIDVLQADLDELLPSIGSGGIDKLNQSDIETLSQTLARMTRELAALRDRLQASSDRADMDDRLIKDELEYFQSVTDGGRPRRDPRRPGGEIGYRSSIGS